MDTSPDHPPGKLTPRRRLRPRLIALALLLGVYLVLFWFVGLANFFILHPTTHPIDVPNATRQLIPFDGGNLELWSARTRINSSPGGVPLAYVIEYSPNAGRAEFGLMYGIGAWEGMAIEYIAVNYPGYGGSTGPATLAGVHRSALAAYDAIAARADGKPIFVTGMSLGTTAALHVAASRPVSGIILQNPVPLRHLIMGKFGWWNLWLLALPISRDIPAELDAVANATRASAPAIFVLADQDTLVPPRFQQQVLSAYPAEKRVITFPGGHNDELQGPPRTEFRRALEWLWTTQVGSTGPASLPRAATPNDLDIAQTIRNAATQPTSRPIH